MRVRVRVGVGVGVRVRVTLAVGRVAEKEAGRAARVDIVQRDHLLRVRLG